MKKIDEIIVISDYDYTYNCNVWYKGITECPEVEAIIRDYCFERDAAIKDILATYECDVLLCVDGDIEYFEYKNEETPKKYFTPAEVRDMSPAEVKANYMAIIESMKKWS